MRLRCGPDNIKKFKRNMRMCCGPDSSGTGQGSVLDSYENDNEPAGSVKDGEFLLQLSDYQLLKNYSTAWN
jgi:hypothetical protein